MKKMDVYYEEHKKKKERLDIIESILNGLLAFIIFFNICNSVGGIKEIFFYPEADYEYLQTISSKVLVDNSINVEVLNEREDIEYTITYTKNEKETEWSKCDIKLSKEDSKAIVYTSIKRNNDDTLRMSIEDSQNILDTICLGIFLLCIFMIIASLAGILISSIICYFIKIILYTIHLLKQTKNTKK